MAVGNYTGERVHPNVKRQVIGLLASQLSNGRIARLCRVTPRTVKAIAAAHSEAITTQKQRILSSALRVATGAIDQIEDELHDGKIKGAQLIPVFGVCVDKVGDLTREPQQIEVHHTHDHAVNIYAKLDAFASALRIAEQPPTTPLALQDGSTPVSAEEAKKEIPSNSPSDV